VLAEGHEGMQKFMLVWATANIHVDLVLVAPDKSLLLMRSYHEWLRHYRDRETVLDRIPGVIDREVDSRVAEPSAKRARS